MKTRLVRAMTAVVLGVSSWAPITAQEEAPLSPEEGGPRIFEVTADSLNLRAGPSTRAAKRASLDRGTILSNLGCRKSEGRVWCGVQPITGGARGFVAAEYLGLVVGPDGQVARGPDNSALRAGQADFDATTIMPCSRRPAGAMTECEAGVARSGGGFATVVVKHSEGRTRAIYFANGMAIGAGTSEADRTGNFVSSKSADVHYINVGDERYEIVDAIILGG